MRRDDRRGRAVIHGLETLIVAALVGAILATVAILNRAHGGEAFYDRNGSFAGSSSTHGNSTTFTDRNGRFDGTAIRNSNGTTSFYDRSGRFTGSASPTGTNSNPLSGGRK
jgi:hypothetical protein